MPEDKQAQEQGQEEPISPPAEEAEAAQEQVEKEAQGEAAEEPGAQERQEEQEPEHVPYERFSKIYGRMKHLERELDGLRRSGAEPTEAKKEQGDLRAPREEDFENYEQYQEARIDYLVKKEVREERQRNKEALELERQAKLWRAFDEKVARAELKDPKFREKAYLPVGLEQHIIDSDQAIEICYYLGDHPEARDHLLSLDPRAAAREIGKLEVRVTQALKKKPETTNAPEVINRLSGGSAPVVEKDITKMSQKERIAIWEAQRLKAGVQG